MRAILINAEQKKVEDIDLPNSFPEFDTAVRQYINTPNAHTFHLNKYTSMIIDTGAHHIDSNNAFYSILSDGWPIFGNVICFGWDPLNEDSLYDLYHAYDETWLQLRWCDQETANRNRAIAERKYQSYYSRIIHGHLDISAEELN